jgi:hypothetical protein
MKYFAIQCITMQTKNSINFNIAYSRLLRSRFSLPCNTAIACVARLFIYLKNPSSPILLLVCSFS